jgi:hypothetical protein
LAFFDTAAFRFGSVHGTSPRTITNCLSTTASLS